MCLSLARMRRFSAGEDAQDQPKARSCGSLPFGILGSEYTTRFALCYASFIAPASHTIPFDLVS